MSHGDCAGIHRPSAYNASAFYFAPPSSGYADADDIIASKDI